VVLLEHPKISPIKSQVLARIAAVLEVPETLVNLKGKTGEGVGEVGRGELAVAHCVALLTRV
jgi:2-C-methyl-D-erythritol 2,4-cyclodiphosphate synthase